MKKKFVGLMTLCLMLSMVSVASATLMSDTQDWIDTNSYGIESVDVVNNQVNSEFWELTNGSQMSALTYYFNGGDGRYGFGIVSSTNQHVTIFDRNDKPVDFAITLHFFENEVYVAPFGETPTGYDFTGDTFGYWMRYNDGDGRNDQFVYSSDIYDGSFLSVQLDAGSYLFSGDFDGMNMIVQAESVTHAPVPEPATMLLFGSGLVGLAGAARRKKLKELKELKEKV